MNGPARDRVLCVDDEPNVLRALAVQIGRRYELETATDGATALEIVRRGPAFAVVISDMRMPGMSGAELLAAVRREAPDTSRVLLTGMADLETAMTAVNQGQLLRFLTKPCETPLLLAAVEAGVEHHRLRTAERELLERTLTGTVTLLGDVLALANPQAFGRASRVRAYVRELAGEFDRLALWEVETAAMLSQIGYVTLDPTVAEKMLQGAALTPDEERLVLQLPAVTERLLGHVPRLEVVRQILRKVRHTAAEGEAPPPLESLAPAELAGQILRIALDFDRLDARGESLDSVLAVMEARGGRYHAALLRLFARQRRSEHFVRDLLLLNPGELTVDYVLAEDLRTGSGILLAARGYHVTETLIERLRNAHDRESLGPIRCVRASNRPRKERAA